MRTNPEAPGYVGFIHRRSWQRGLAVSRSGSFLKFFGWISLAVFGLIIPGGRIYGAGTVVGWGYSSNAPSDLTNIIAIAAGSTEYSYYLNPSVPCLALRSDGTVVA